MALAVTTPAPLVPLWDPLSADAKLALGTGLPVKLRVERAAGVTGAVRLTLLTTQAMPRKKEKVWSRPISRAVHQTQRTEAQPSGFSRSAYEPRYCPTTVQPDRWPLKAVPS